MTETLQPSKSLRHLTGKTIADYDMIRQGDRILPGLSGDKDSLSLLYALLQLQRHAPIPFELAVITIDPQSDGFDPSPLKSYVESLNLRYHFVSEPVVALAEKHMRGDSYCSWCARMKRGLMYKTARTYNYNVLALAQHLDDLAESFLMSAFHGGRLRPITPMTMVIFASYGLLFMSGKNCWQPIHRMWACRSLVRTVRPVTLAQLNTST